MTSAVFTYDVTGLSNNQRNALLTTGVNGSGPAVMVAGSGHNRALEASFIAQKHTSRPALFMGERILFQLERRIVGDTTVALRQGCALLGPRTPVVNIRTHHTPA